jgi:hypothetical protein
MNKSGCTHVPDADEIHGVMVSAFLFHSRNFANMQDGGLVGSPFPDQGATFFLGADLPLSRIKSSWWHDHTMELRGHGQNTLKQPLTDVAGGARSLMIARSSSGRKLKRIEKTNWQSYFICRANAVPTAPQISSR